MSGPNAAALPAYEAPKSIANKAIMISSMLMSYGLALIILPAPKNIAANTKYWPN
jgi:hypothetical protein